MTIIRERLSEVARKFDRIDVALFTSFNFNADFFVQNVLPALFGVDEAASRAVRAYEVNKALEKTDVGVFYDPSVAKLHGKPYRYTHYPVFIQGALFHAKNIFLVGKINGKRWIYVATMSANLTLSGWGRNREVIADTWIHCNNEQPWRAVRDYLAWLQKQFPAARKTESPLINAIKLLSDGIYERRTLPDPEGHAWLDKTYRRLYFSPLHNSFWGFIKLLKVGAIFGLEVAAPYWGAPKFSLDELKKEYEMDDEIAISLVMARLPPAMRTTGLGIIDKNALSQQWGKLQFRVWENTTGRLHHLKAYRFSTDIGTLGAVGSCNFSEPGLFWKRKSDKGKGSVTGNVESMMIDLDPGLEWKTVGAKDDDFGAENQPDDAPEPWPFHVLVFYDWKTEVFSWSVKGDIGQVSPVLTFSGHCVKLADTAKEGRKKGKLANGLYTVKLTGPDAGEVLDMTGCVIELNLQESTREYTAPLAAESILLSWIQGAANEPLPNGLDVAEPAAGENEWQGEAAGIMVDQEAPFFEFFDFYRAVRQLRTRLQELEKNEDARADLLLHRADSVASLASVILASAHDPVIKYLVLSECLSLLSRGNFTQANVCKRLKACSSRLSRQRSLFRETMKQSIKNEKHHLDEAGLDALLAWYDNELKRS
ncbi:MAG: hypothetical protein G3H99_01245 [Ferrovum sp.]|jgi:hypothetical protein|nr:hypothetical protein [Ferrovum sp.]